MLLDLSISIINTNNKDLTLGCLESIYANTRVASFEVLLVDNVSTDGSIEAVGAKFPEVDMVVNAVREGFAANHNKNIKRSKGSRYVLVLNEDTYLKPGAIDTLVGFMDGHKDSGACGGTLLNEDGSLQHTGKFAPTLTAAVLISLGVHKVFPNNPVTAKYFHVKDDYSEFEEVEHINGACLMVRRDTIDDVGLLDERFFVFCEDVDWCLRMREKGWKIYYVKAAEIYHYRGSSSASPRMIRVYHESLRKFYDKHFAPRRPFFVNWLVYAGIKSRLYISLMRGRIR